MDCKRKDNLIASSNEYLKYVLDLLADVPEITTCKMMREYLLYAPERLFWGVYYVHFLVKKDTMASRAMLSTKEPPDDVMSTMLLIGTEDADCRRDGISHAPRAVLSQEAPQVSR